MPAGKRDCIALRDKEREIQKNLADGISTANGKLTVKELFDKYLALHSNVKRSTAESRRYMARMLSADELSTKPITSVKPSDAQEWALRMQEKGYTFRVIENMKRSLRAAFQIAVEDGWIRNNPVSFSLSSVIRNENADRIDGRTGESPAQLPPV